MKHMHLRALMTLALATQLGACESEPTGPEALDTAPVFALESAEAAGGAIVSNSGLGKDDVNCNFGGFFTNEGTAVRSPNGIGQLSCQFGGLPPIPEVDRQTGWLCNLFQGGFSQTRQSSWVRTTSGTASLTCHFQGKPLYNAAVLAGGSWVAAQEARFSQPLAEYPAGELTGQVANVGRACFFDPLLDDPAGKIALIERGACFFSDKLENVRAAGAVASIVYNSEAGGEDIIAMNAPAGVTVDIPGVFVARSTGFVLLGIGGESVTLRACGQSASCRGVF